MSYLKEEYRKLIDLLCKMNNKIRAQDIFEKNQRRDSRKEKEVVNMNKKIYKFWRK